MRDPWGTYINYRGLAVMEGKKGEGIARRGPEKDCFTFFVYLKWERI